MTNYDRGEPPTARGGALSLSMAHHGRDSGGSQFCFVLDDDKGRDWNGVHTVFGRTTSGIDGLRAIAQADTIVHIRVGP